MEITLLAVVPALGAVLYTVLLTVIRRRAVQSRGLVYFEFMLVLLVVSSVSSVAWHTTRTTPAASDAILRLLTWSDVSIGPALLAFVATKYRGRWSSRARRASLVLAIAVVGVALSGAMNRAILEPVENPRLLDMLVAYATVLAALGSYMAAAGYLAYAHRRERDPFERNRLKVILVATLLIVAGLLTNLVSAFQQYPIDRSAAIVGSLVIFFSLIRYRLFDIDLALKKGFVAVGSIAVVAPLYLAVLLGVTRLYMDATATTMYLIGIALVPLAVAGTYLLRAALKHIADRLFVGRFKDSDAIAADFIQSAQRLLNTHELAELIARTCQGHFEARVAAVLLRNGTTGRLETRSIHGPFASLHVRSDIDLENPILARVAESAEPVTPARLADMQQGVSEEHIRQFSHLSGCLLQAIVGRGEVVGLIVIGEHVYDDPYSLNDLRLLATIAVQSALAVESASLFEQVQAHAETDYLTGLINHRRLKDVLNQALADAEERGGMVSVAMVDVDNFKLLNDTYGHVAGDDALRRIAGFLSGAVRPADLVGRYGGDEFMVVLPDTAHRDASRLLADIARQARHMSLSTEGNEGSSADHIPMRLSWGVATYPDHAPTVRTLVAAADSDLMKRRYVQRRSGTEQMARPFLRHMSEHDPRGVRIACDLLDLLDTKDDYTTEHSHQVASLGLLLAEELRLSEEDRELLWLGGLLHDVGKINVPDEVLRKPGSLTPSEWSLIHEHPVQGAQLVVGLFGPGPLADIVGSHHERFDGMGYPYGLIGREIPLLVRAVSVCDAYSAMVHDRPYRKGLTQPEAITELRAGAGTQWDADVVEAFIRAISREDRASEPSPPSPASSTLLAEPAAGR